MLKFIWHYSTHYGGNINKRKKIKLKNNRHAIKNGIAYVSEDRLNTGLIMEESIHNNIISTIFDKISNKINLINQTRAYQKSNQLIQSLKIKLSNSDLPVNTLSGGNAQRVSIAKWLATSPQIIILDSPTIGVDIANKEEIFNIIRAMITQGISVIFITDEVEEAYYNSHRILIMKKGEITHELYSAKCSEKDIEEAIYESN